MKYSEIIENRINSVSNFKELQKVYSYFKRIGFDLDSEEDEDKEFEYNGKVYCFSYFENNDSTNSIYLVLVFIDEDTYSGSNDGEIEGTIDMSRGLSANLFLKELEKEFLIKNRMLKLKKLK